MTASRQSALVFFFRHTFSLEVLNLILVSKNEVYIVVRGQDKQENCALFKNVEAEGSVHWFRALAVLPEDQNLIPSTHKHL